MPDLGNYAQAVLLAYGGSLSVLALLVGISWRRFGRVARALREVENA